MQDLKNKNAYKKEEREKLEDLVRHLMWVNYSGHRGYAKPEGILNIAVYGENEKTKKHLKAIPQDSQEKLNQYLKATYFKIGDDFAEKEFNHKEIAEIIEAF